MERFDLVRNLSSLSLSPRLLCVSAPVGLFWRLPGHPMPLDLWRLRDTITVIGVFTWRIEENCR